MLSGVSPAPESCASSAMVKQPACAAAINSSGFVPAPVSKRLRKEYGVWESTPLSVETVPLPSFSAPFHSADALRIKGSSAGLFLCHRLDSSEERKVLLPALRWRQFASVRAYSAGCAGRRVS